MGATLSKIRSPDSRIAEGDIGSSPQIEKRSIRKRSTVKPPARNAPRTGQIAVCQGQEDEAKKEDSGFSNVSRTVDNVDSITKKWDSAMVGFVAIGIVFVLIFLYFGIPAFYKFFEKAHSS